RIALDQAAPLPEDEYFYYQLIGLPVYDEAGTFLGRLEEILETGANDVYVIRGGPGGELLLPALKSVIPRIDLEDGRIVARPLRYYEEWCGRGRPRRLWTTLQTSLIGTPLASSKTRRW